MRAFEIKFYSLFVRQKRVCIEAWCKETDSMQPIRRDIITKSEGAWERMKAWRLEDLDERKSRERKNDTFFLQSYFLNLFKNIAVLAQQARASTNRWRVGRRLTVEARGRRSLIGQRRLWFGKTVDIVLCTAKGLGNLENVSNPQENFIGILIGHNLREGRSAFKTAINLWRENSFDQLPEELWSSPTLGSFQRARRASAASQWISSCKHT